MSRRYIEGTEGIEQAGGLVKITTADDNEFLVHSSYLEQQAGPLISPYGNGEVVFDGKDGSYRTNEENIVAPADVLTFSGKVWIVMQDSDDGDETYIHGAFTDMQSAIVHRDKMRDEHDEIKRAEGQYEDAHDVIYVKETSLID